MNVDPGRLVALKRDIARWRELVCEEDKNGRASFELIDLEDTLGAYRDVLERLVSE